jgi:hypothetical protein
MSPLPPNPRGPRQPAHEAAVIAQVLDALVAHRDDAAEGEGAHAVDRGAATPPAIEDLLAAAISELSRHPAANRPWSASAPVLGSGVLQRILAGRRNPAGEPPPDAAGAPHVDERL